MADLKLSKSKSYPFQGDFHWSGVSMEQYKAEGEGWEGITRQVLAGDELGTAFHLRYFEISPGGFSSLEKHGHAHVIVGVRGSGRLVSGQDCFTVHLLDTFHVASWEPHQLINDTEEPFGFLCLVDAKRDRPQSLSTDELAALLAKPVLGKLIRLGNGKGLSCDLTTDKP